MDDELAELILEDFNKAVGVHDTIWYDLGITLYERIISTINEYNKVKRKEGEVFEYKTEFNADNSV